MDEQFFCTESTVSKQVDIGNLNHSPAYHDAITSNNFI